MHISSKWSKEPWKNPLPRLSEEKIDIRIVAFSGTWTWTVSRKACASKSRFVCANITIYFEMLDEDFSGMPAIPGSISGDERLSSCSNREMV